MLNLIPSLCSVLSAPLGGHEKRSDQFMLTFSVLEGKGRTLEDKTKWRFPPENTAGQMGMCRLSRCYDCAQFRRTRDCYIHPRTSDPVSGVEELEGLRPRHETKPGSIWTFAQSSQADSWHVLQEATEDRRGLPDPKLGPHITWQPFCLHPFQESPDHWPSRRRRGRKPKREKTGQGWAQRLIKMYQDETQTQAPSRLPSFIAS